MNTITNFLRFLCCKKTKLQTDLYDDISSSGEWYNEWGTEYDKSSSLRNKRAQFYSSIPKIDRQTETLPERYVS